MDILLGIGIILSVIIVCFLPIPLIYLRYFIKQCYEYYKEKPSYIKTIGDLINNSHEISKIWINNNDFSIMPPFSHILLIFYIIYDLFKFICWLIYKICHYIYVIGEKTYINICIKFIWKLIKYIFNKIYKFLYICYKPIRIVFNKFINLKERIYEIKLQ